MKILIRSCRPRAIARISDLKSREYARTRSAPKAAKSTATPESDHLATAAASDNPLSHPSRRRAAAALLLAGSGGAAAAGALSMLQLLLGPRSADAAASAAPTLSSATSKRGIAAYVRKRKLDPLSSYVPAVLAAREQLAGIEGLVESDPVEARIELRSGAFEGLRDNVRAVGEYASEGNSGSSSSPSSSESSKSVKSFFDSVQKLDYELFAAAREKRDPSAAAVEALRAGVAALDALLATVPAADLDEARRLVATAGKVDKGTGASSTTTSAEAETGTAAVAGDDEKLRMIVPGAAP